jgi:hypothetical protein
MKLQNAWIVIRHSIEFGIIINAFAILVSGVKKMKIFVCHAIINAPNVTKEL